MNLTEVFPRGAILKALIEIETELFKFVNVQILKMSL